MEKRLPCHSLLVAAMFVCVMSEGCGNSGPELASVQGTVTFNGKVLSDAVVMFVPKQGGRPATGTTNADGVFALSTLAENDGALVGEHDVLVTKMPPISKNTTAKVDAAGDPAAGSHINLPGVPQRAESAPKPLIPARYGQRGTSGLSAKVKSGSNHLDFHLTP